jgi:hypothetical protein
MKDRVYCCIALVSKIGAVEGVWRFLFDVSWNGQSWCDTDPQTIVHNPKNQQTQSRCAQRRPWYRIRQSTTEIKFGKSR